MADPHNPEAEVSGVTVGEDGIRAGSRDEVILDVLFDGRRIWSFWLHRDGEAKGGEYFVEWPGVLRRFLDGTTRLTIARHADQHPFFDEEIRLGKGEGRIEVVNEEGRPLGIDKSMRLAQTFDTRSDEHVAPLLDSIGEVLDALKRAGADAFVVYGTLLGGVRGGKLIGHDSDADLGYVSKHEHPVDVVRESFVLQRRLAEQGYDITRYSGAAFRVDVAEADGSIRGLDVFGGFLSGGHLHLMGEIRTPFERDWIFPLGTTTLEGRTFAAPANPDRFLAATYGESWRQPDPAFHFETPRSTHRRLTGWFRGTRVMRAEWDRVYSGPRLAEPEIEPTPFARWVREREPAPASYVDIGCGRGTDAYWVASEGTPAVGLDYVSKAFRALEAKAKAQDVPVDYRFFNLDELRTVLAESARVAHSQGPHTVAARHVADATDRVGRHNLWRAAEMMLRGGGRLYLEFLVKRGPGDRFARKNHLRTLPVDLVVAELEGRGAQILHREVLTVNADGTPAGKGSGQPPGSRRIGRLVVEWQA